MPPSTRAARAAFFFFLCLIAISCGDTMTGPTVTPTPAGGPTPTPVSTRIVTVGKGPEGQLSNTFLDTQSGTSTSTIHTGEAIQWVWQSGTHSTTSGTCPLGCVPNGLWDSGVGQGMTFQRTFPTAGSFPYFCSVHGTMMQGTVIVQ
jgi:hypothetical protein